MAGNGGVGEGGRGEGEYGGRGKSMMKLVSSKQNRPMMVVTVSGGVWKQWAIKQQMKKARREGEDGGGGRSMTKAMTKRRGGR